VGLTLMGLIVAINGYYGAVPISQVISFVGVALLATAALHYANLEWTWQRDKVDYSGEIRLELVAYAFFIGLGLLALAYVIPTINPSRWARALLNQPVVSDVEDTLDRAFAGIEPPRQRPIAPGAAGGAGIMPRSFLLGSPPELERNIMLTARTEPVNGARRFRPGVFNHWRGLSYEVYTGRGWTLTEEQWRAHEANELIPQQPVNGSISIRQEVNWRYDDRLIRYTLGFPLLFDQPVATYWRGQSDFVRVASRDIPRYEATSLVAAASAEQLRQVTVEDIDADIIQRYTQLPSELPQRVFDLAAEVTGEARTPYDQAVALERFLRQYAYSLAVDLPPDGTDAVDYFLFDLQEGYCDYYASAMAVMARTLGLPARIATGFLAQPADESGVQTVRQINGHSWTEIYFKDYGWVEFEPTAAFITPHNPLLDAEASSFGSQSGSDSSGLETSPIPERASQPEVPWSDIILTSGALILSGALIIWWIRRPKYEDDVQFAYSRLQENARRLGHSLPPSQTPAEFKAELLDDLDQLSARPALKSLIEQIWSPVTLLTNLFIQQRYSGKPVPHPREAVSLWRRIRQPLFILWLNKRLRGKGNSEKES
jgi:transglutaminase-like putative cysteine protease